MGENIETNFVENHRAGGDAAVELRNGKFIDAKNGRYLEPGTSVIIEGGKIKSVSARENASRGSAPGFTIDLKGKTVMPGLFNTHCHVSMVMPSQVPMMRDIRLSKRLYKRQLAKNMADCLAHGITTVRDAFVSDLGITQTLKENISSGDLPGPRILQSIVVGPIGGYLSERIGTTMRFIRNLLGWPAVDYEAEHSGVVAFPAAAGEKQIRDAVDRAVDERGADFIKIGEQRENMLNFKPTAAIMSAAQLSALTDQTRLRGLRSTMHHVSVESFRRAVECGVSSLAHAPFDSRLTPADVEALNAAGCVIEPTATVGYDVCWKIKGDKYRDHPEMGRLTEFRAETFAAVMDEYWAPDLRDSVMRAYDRITAGRMKALGILDISKLFRYYSGIVAEGTQNIRTLFENGACIALGNDGGVPPSTPAMMGLELKMLEQGINGKAGDALEPKFTGADAVRIATINSARALGLEDSLGSIEAGKTADLVVVDGDPLSDFSVVGSRVAALFLDGRLVIDNCGLQE